MAGFGAFLPLGVLTDSYKASHFLQYPPSKQMVAVSAWQPFCFGCWSRSGQQAFGWSTSYDPPQPCVPCSTESLDRATEGTPATLASCCMGCATSWKPSSSGAGDWRMWTCPTSSTGG